MSDQPAITLPVVKVETKTNRRPKRQPPYHVVLLDDDQHSYEYVIEMLQKLFAHEIEKAFLMAKEVDSTGRVIVLTTTKEHAEFKCEQIHGYGPDERIATCVGAMSSIIEPAED